MASRLGRLRHWWGNYVQGVKEFWSFLPDPPDAPVPRKLDWKDWKMIVKLTFMMYRLSWRETFAHGRDASRQRRERMEKARAIVSKLSEVGTDVKSSVESGQLQGRLEEVRDRAQGLAPHLQAFLVARLALLRETMAEFSAGYKEARDSKQPVPPLNPSELLQSAQQWWSANRTEVGDRMRQLVDSRLQSAAALRNKSRGEIIAQVRDAAKDAAFQTSEHMQRTLRANVATLRDVMTPQSLSDTPPPHAISGGLPSDDAAAAADAADAAAPAPRSRPTAEQIAAAYLRRHGYAPDGTPLPPEQRPPSPVAAAVQRGAAIIAGNVQENVAVLSQWVRAGAARAEAHVRQYGPAPGPGQPSTAQGAPAGQAPGTAAAAAGDAVPAAAGAADAAAAASGTAVSDAVAADRAAAVSRPDATPRP